LEIQSFPKGFGTGGLPRENSFFKRLLKFSLFPKESLFRKPPLGIPKGFPRGIGTG